MITIYVLIVPAFILYVIGMVAARFVPTNSPDLRFLLPYLVSVLLWSTMGFLTANALLVGLWFVDGVLSDPEGGGGDGRLIALLVVAPVVVSVGGLLGGAVFAVRRVDKKRKAAGPAPRPIEVTAAPRAGRD